MKWRRCGGWTERNEMEIGPVSRDDRQTTRKRKQAGQTGNQSSPHSSPRQYFFFSLLPLMTVIKVYSGASLVHNNDPGRNWCRTRSREYSSEPIRLTTSQPLDWEIGSAIHLHHDETRLHGKKKQPSIYDHHSKE